MNNILITIKEDIEDIWFMIRCVFFNGEKSPLNIISKTQLDRFNKLCEKLTNEYKDSLKNDHEPDEIETISKSYSKYIHRKANVLLYDFDTPSISDKQYLSYYRNKLKSGEISKYEFLYERVLYKLCTSYWFYFRMSVYGFCLTFLPILIFL
jgi:hypothetical protein